MRLASSYSLNPNPAEAAAEAADGMLERLGAAPELILLYTTEQLATPALIEALAERAPGAQIVGGTSCAGVMTDQGFHCGPGGAVGLLGISDPDGAYGVADSPLGDDPFAAAAAAVEDALMAAGRDFETPVLVWCCQPPGCEEAVIAGVQSVIGRSTPVIGGSSADEAIAGRWRQFTQGGVLRDHVVISVWFPSAAHGAAFQSGYAPAEHSGVVTRADRRDIHEIDHRPAAEVYAEWTGGSVAADEQGMILAKSTPTPLGRVAAEQHGVPLYLLSHPSVIGPGGALSLFTDVAEGERVHLMRGSAQSLIKRAGLVVGDAHASGGWTSADTRGGLVIYCGGCMLHVRDRMDEVAAQVAEAMSGAPFLGAFTFGEQGAIVDNCNRHGNLMVAALTFG